ncbi:MAG TPA: cysteine desulfurase [archaeon]|nr:cysteine desulfurase [archaeon]
MISEKIRADFPMLQKHPNLIYFDNASTTLKPVPVIAAMNEYYEQLTSNTGRGSHHISQQATQRFEESREDVAKFVGAKAQELAFTRNATESINLTTVSLERMGHFKTGDEIVVSFMEHHANLVPWQELCRRTGAKLQVVKLNADYTLNMEDLRSKVSRKTKMVSIAHAANTVGSIQPAAEIAKIAHDNGALFLLDGAQSVPHMSVDVKKIGCDFLVFSAHKMLGPTGIGALYGKRELLEKMPPYNYGGGIISHVSAEKSEYVSAPQRFEAGTTPIAEAFGFAAAAKYLKKLGMENVREHDRKLTEHCIAKLGGISGVQMYCPKNAQKQGGIVLFGSRSLDAVDLAVALDEAANIAVRSGMHCAEPIVRSINPKGLCRASFYLYNTMAEIDTFASKVMAITVAFK